MNKTSKAGALSALIISIVVVALLNIFTFVIPFNKLDAASHYTVYGCTELILVLFAILSITQFFLENIPNQRIIALPIAFYGYVTIIIQIVLNIVVFIVNAFIAIPVWIIVILESIIFGFGIIQITKGFFFKARNEEYHNNVANTKFMDEFRARLKALEKINKNENISDELTDLVDIALGSDPITNDKTIDSENELLSLLQELDEAIKEGSLEEARHAIEKTKNALYERNVLCKAGK